MRTIIETDPFPVDLSLGARKQSESITTIDDMSSQRNRINSNHSEEDSVLSDCTFIPSISSPSSISVLPSSNTR